MKLFLGLEQNNMEINNFKKLFATSMTTYIHGEEKAMNAEKEASAIFENQDLTS